MKTEQATSADFAVLVFGLWPWAFVRVSWFLPFKDLSPKTKDQNGELCG
jgi:hypothetical protein